MRADCMGSCGQLIVDTAARFGTDVEVSSMPFPPSPYTEDVFVCPDGVTYFIRPTLRQIEKWRRDERDTGVQRGGAS